MQGIGRGRSAFLCGLLASAVLSACGASRQGKLDRANAHARGSAGRADAHSSPRDQREHAPEPRGSHDARRAPAPSSQSGWGSQAPYGGDPRSPLWFGSSQGTSGSSGSGGGQSGRDFAEGLGCLLVLPWCLPWQGVGAPVAATYEEFPYANGALGFLRPAPASGSERGAEPATEPPAASEGGSTGAGGRRWSLRAASEASYVFDDVLRGRLALRLQTPSLVELEVTEALLAERIEDSNDPAQGELETAALGTYGVALRFAQSPVVQFRTGLGYVTWSHDGEWFQGAFGSYGVDFFPRAPLIGSIDVQLGRLGEAFYYDARATVGVALQRFEVYVGYDAMGLDDEPFAGPLMGLRVWF